MAMKVSHFYTAYVWASLFCTKKALGPCIRALPCHNFIVIYSDFLVYHFLTNFLSDHMKSLPLGRWGLADFIRPWGTLIFHLPLWGLDKCWVKNFPHFGKGDRGQIMLKFFCLFQGKLKFSIFFFQGSVMTSKIYWSIKWFVI